MAFLTPPTCLQLPPSAYTNLPDSTPLCRLIPPLPPEQHLHTLLNHGFETFTYGDTSTHPRPPAHLLTRLAIHPRQLPRINPRIVAQYVDNALTTLSHDRLHLLQVAWLDHRDTRFIDFLGEVGELVRLGKVRSVGVTDFPTASLNRLIDAGISISSNQVSFSMVDTRALVRLKDFCKSHHIGLLARGALVGGLLSERYLGVPEPRRKLGVVRAWGGWSLLQEVLYACKTVADRYGVTMANVAMRWALERGVSAVVVGGGAEYAESNVKVFEFELCEEDLGLLEGASSRGNDLFKILGDCGTEVQVR